MMTDIHSHILHSLDDGAVDMQESVRMLGAAQQAGIDRIVATPHLRKPSFDYGLAAERWAELSEVAAGMRMRLEMGYEVHWNVLVAMDACDYQKHCFRGSRKMLVEFSLSADDLPDGHDRVIYSVQRSGIDIIIAHPERYRFVQRDLSLAERWRDMGCMLQLDAICLRHGYEPGSKHTAKRLFQRGLYSFYASDAHCGADYDLFAKSLEWISKRR